MHVIEVNLAPDLTLSTEGVGCNKPSSFLGGASGCVGGSTAYDHTKRAAAYNTVQLVYSRRGVASQLTKLIERNAREIGALDQLLVRPARLALRASPQQPAAVRNSPQETWEMPAAPAAPTAATAAAARSELRGGQERVGQDRGGFDLSGPQSRGAALTADASVVSSSAPSSSSPPMGKVRVPVLQQDVAEYLLDWLRESQSAGCFAPVYPSSRHHELHGQQIDLMAMRGAAACPPRNATHSATPARCTGYDGKRRQQMHALLGILQRDLATRRRPFKVPRPDPTCFTITHPTSHIAYPTSHIGSHMVGVLGSACACACTCPCTYIFTCRAHAPGQSPSLYPVPPPTVAMRVHAQGSGQPTVHIASCMGAAHARLQAQPDLGARVLIKTRSGSSSPDLEGDRLRACSLPEPRLPNAPRHEEREVRSRTYTRGTGGAVGVHRVVVPSL